MLIYTSYRAAPEQRSRFEILGSGSGIRWPEVDEDISVEGMLYGIPARRPAEQRSVRVSDWQIRVQIPKFSDFRHLNSARSRPHEIYFYPLLLAFLAFLTICPLDNAFSSAMLGLREDVSHRKRPDGKLPAPAIIVNFGVAAHW
jgi:hypothetical protein